MLDLRPQTYVHRRSKTSFIRFSLQRVTSKQHVRIRRLVYLPTLIFSIFMRLRITLCAHNIYVLCAHVLALCAHKLCLLGKDGVDRFMCASSI